MARRAAPVALQRKRAEPSLLWRVNPSRAHMKLCFVGKVQAQGNSLCSMHVGATGFHGGLKGTTSNEADVDFFASRCPVDTQQIYQSRIVMGGGEVGHLGSLSSQMNIRSFH